MLLSPGDIKFQNRLASARSGVALYGAFPSLFASSGAVVTVG
jgi:hypothetical protein